MRRGRRNRGGEVWKEEARRERVKGEDEERRS
jgi:hypothetical protein